MALKKASVPDGDVKFENYGDGPVAMSGGSLNHSIVIGNLADLFGAFLRKHVCKRYLSDTKVILSESQWFYPDLSVVCDRSKLTFDGILGAPDLVVEVLSDSTEMRDRAYKLHAYFSHGAREVWLVSWENKSVEVYTAPDALCLYKIFKQRELNAMSEAEKAMFVFDQVRSKLFLDFTPGLSEIFDDLFT